MSILHLISSEGYYGAEAMLVALARHTARLGFPTAVAVFHDRRRPHLEVAEQARQSGLEVETAPCAGRWDRGAVRRLREMLDRRGVDLLHTHGYKADVYGALAAGRDCALVATCHNWPARQPLMRLYAKLDRRVLRRFDRVAAVSDSVAAILVRSGLARRKLTVIPNGVDVERFTGAHPAIGSAGAGLHIVGFVGRLVEKKGGRVLLRAAQTVLKACPDTLFVLAGHGPLRTEWEALASRTGISKRVLFLGARTDMPGVYAALDLLVLPSWEEASPMCVLEAMAAGRPVVATRVGALQELVVPGVTGFLVDPGDVPALAGAIVKLLRTPDLARRFGENGRARIARYYSAENMAANYIELYKDALAAHAHGNAPDLDHRRVPQ